MAARPKKHTQSYIKVDRILPNSWNANEQDERSFDLLVDDVAGTGFIDSLTVVPLEGGSYRIIGGEHRWRAAKAAGEEEVPCLVLEGDKWKDEDLQKFVTVRMNMIKGKLNPEKFLRLYAEMADKYGKEQLQKLFGFADKRAFNRITKGVVSAAKRSLPKEMHGDLDEAAKDAKSVEDLGRIVQEMYAKYGDTAQQSFIVFTHGKQDHIYISMSTATRKAMDKIITYCKVTRTDINDVVAGILQEGVAARAEALDASTKSSGDSGGDSDPF